MVWKLEDLQIHVNTFSEKPMDQTLSKEILKKHILREIKIKK